MLQNMPIKSQMICQSSNMKYLSFQQIKLENITVRWFVKEKISCMMKMGDCPVCGMPLEKIPEPKPAVLYACPDHPDEKFDVPGDCPICNQSLEPIVEEVPEEKNEAYEDMKKRFLLSLIFTIPVVSIAMLGHLIPSLHHAMLDLLSQRSWDFIQFGLIIPMMFYTGDIFLKRAWSSLKTRNLNMWTLIGIGTLVAFVFSVVGLLFPDLFPEQFKENGAVHVYFEATCTILLLVMIGQLMELRAHAQTNSALKLLLNWSPSTATIIKNDKELKVALEHIEKGDIVKIKPGEKIPVDGIIIEGKGVVDQSMISGEPIPVDVSVNDEITSGSINTNGSFLLKANKVGAETLLSKIINMVNDASRSRAPIQKIADQISSYFVPIVVSVSILTFVVWMFFYNGENAATYALVNAIAVLLIACPCALGLATPMSIMVGTGKAAQNGILIKDAEALQEFNKIDVLMIDKTGTLTEGKPEVKTILPFNGTEIKDVLTIAASIDQNSNHPLTKAVLREAKRKGVETLPIKEYDYKIGKGAEAVIDNELFSIGNDKIVDTSSISKEDKDLVTSFQNEGDTVVYISRSNKVIGAIAINDPVKKEAEKEVKALKDLGIEVVMLTGDNEMTAKNVADKLFIQNTSPTAYQKISLMSLRSIKVKG